MKQVLIRQGAAVVTDVPAPTVEPGTILVRVERSCISIGSEVSGMRASGASLIERAQREPQRVKTIAKMVVADGLAKTRKRILAKLGIGHATGYSAAGRIVEVGEGVDDLKVGDRVACAGAQCAHHAEIIRVPRNLAVRIPEGADIEEASTVALGGIAMQGVRRASPTLGETFVVVGLGVMGQLVAQLLRVNGCRVIGVDFDEQRLALAKELALEAALRPGDGAEVEQVRRLTDGHGADGVIVTAAGSSSEILSTAFKMCRKKGRVVLVGDVGLDLQRADLYPKELDFFISTSYGPGRYDGRYEEEGLDYPIGYVRWTENRNMAEYVRLLASGGIRVRPLISSVYDVRDGAAAYQAIADDSKKPLLVLLSYPQEPGTEVGARVVRTASSKPTVKGRLRVAVVGVGEFATANHLPNIHALRDRVELRCVMSRTGHKATEIARQYGAQYATTDFEQVLRDGDVDAVLITTRHDSHAALTLSALGAGKHVFVEKPLALTEDEVAAIERFYVGREGRSAPVLLTGFNRRFSPHVRAIKAATADRSNPMILGYFMNAGYIQAEHWVHGPEGGGRNRGEACHIYDLFTYLTGARFTGLAVSALRPTTGHYGASDNFVATVSFDDGSVATLTYTALGTPKYPKETLTVACDGKVTVLEDYQRLATFGRRTSKKATLAPDKGLLSEWVAFADCIRDGGEWPISLWQQVQATRIANAVEEHLSPAEANRSGVRSVEEKQ